MSNQTVIVAAVRTPFGRFGGALQDTQSIDLGAHVIRELLKRVKLPGKEVNCVYYGTCIDAEIALESNIPARQAMLRAGLPPETLSLTVDRACCSSLTAVHLGYRDILLKEAEVVIAMGAENMGRAPYLLPQLRMGQKRGDVMFHDPIFHGMSYKGFGAVAYDAGVVALKHGVTREEQDQWALRSQQRYAKALAEGKFKEEIVPFALPQKKGNPILFSQDEMPKPDTTLEKLAKLPTVFNSPTVTAGNAPGLDAGASAILLMSRKKAESLGLRPLARVIGGASVAREGSLIAEVPAAAIEKILEKTGKTLEEIDLIEINEAFAAMPLVSSKILAKGDPQKTEKIREKINVNGGAVAIGHPVGASGARILLTLMYELRRHGGGLGVAAICGGLAQGDSCMIEVETNHETGRHLW
jgi:acetyl-CoA C-acetyltransferase